MPRTTHIKVIVHFATLHMNHVNEHTDPVVVLQLLPCTHALRAGRPGPGTARTDGRAIATVGRALLMPLCTRATRMGFVHTRMGLSMIECSMNTDELCTH